MIEGFLGRRRGKGGTSNRNGDLFEGFVRVDFSDNSILQTFIRRMGAESLGGYVGFAEQIHHLRDLEPWGGLWRGWLRQRALHDLCNTGSPLHITSRGRWGLDRAVCNLRPALSSQLCIDG